MQFKPFLSLHRFESIVSTFYCFIVFGKKHRAYSIVLFFHRFIVSSLYRFIVVKNKEFSYRSMVSSFYSCKSSVLSLDNNPFIIAFYRFIVAGETNLTVCDSCGLATLFLPIVFILTHTYFVQYMFCYCNILKTSGRRDTIYCLYQ